MKPLSEWTAEELRATIVDREAVAWSHLDGVMDELLRRARAEERERCAKLCEARAVDLIAQPADHGRSVATRELWAVAKDIRGLQ